MLIGSSQKLCNRVGIRFYALIIIAVNTNRPVRLHGILLAYVVDSTTRHWSGQVTCFPSNPLPCWLLAQWDQGYADPWLVVTDLPAADASIHGYGFRCWIECSYRDLKSDGWCWGKTRVQSPDRAERYRLAMAVALLWMISCGREQERVETEGFEEDSTSSPPSTHPRQLSCFVQGLLTILGRLLTHQSLGLESWFPLPSQLSSPSLVFNSSQLLKTYPCKPQTAHRERYAPQPPTYWVTRWPLNCGATLRPVLVCIGCESSLQKDFISHLMRSRHHPYLKDEIAGVAKPVLVSLALSLSCL